MTHNLSDQDIKMDYSWCYVQGQTEGLWYLLYNLHKEINKNYLDRSQPHNLTEILWIDGRKSEILYCEDDINDKYVLIRYHLPYGCYGEVSGGTFAELSGFRIYYAAPPA